MAKAKSHKWEFCPRFRRNAFGWKSQPAMKRIKEAVSEIKKAARIDKVLAAEGAVLFLEKLSPAIEHVDSSSGAIGSLVNNAITDLANVIAVAPADLELRKQWLQRLQKALEEDQIPYLENLAEYWGELCASSDLAAEWADRLLELARRSLGPDKVGVRHYKETCCCLSALLAAERYEEILTLLRDENFWPYKSWAVKAYIARGEEDQAIRCAESCRSPWASDSQIDRMCESILLSSDRAEEAYERYALRANQKNTYLAWFRGLVKKYPDKEPARILEDLVKENPGEEGKWFAAAKSAKLFDEAIALANRTPCSPKTLTRAARDFEESEPAFAMEAGMASLHWLMQGYGYDITGLDVLSAFAHTMKAAKKVGRADDTRARIAKLVEAPDGDPFVSDIIGQRLERS